MGSMLANSLSGVFGGGTNQPAEDQQRYQAPTQPEQNGGNLTAQQQQQWGPNCQFATKDFTRCLDEQAGNMQICGWYLEQLVGVSPCFVVLARLGVVGTRLLTGLVATEAVPEGRRPVLIHSAVGSAWQMVN